MAWYLRQAYDYWQDRPDLFVTIGLNTGMTMATPEMSNQVVLCNSLEGPRQ